MRRHLIRKQVLANLRRTSEQKSKRQTKSVYLFAT